MKSSCYTHTSDKTKKIFCTNEFCAHNLLSPQRLAAGITICRQCDNGMNGFKRIEHMYLDSFKQWNLAPSSHDTVIQDANCDYIETHDEDDPHKTKLNKKRADFIWLTPPGHPYHVIFECDEFGHNGSLPQCEYKGLQDRVDQITSNLEVLKPVLVVRFNPNNKKIDVKVKVKSALEKALRGDYPPIKDARGFEVVEFIGFPQKRMQQYNESGIRKRLKI